MTQKERELAIEQLRRISKNLASIGETADYTELIVQALEQEPKWIPISERLPNLDDYNGSEIWQKKVLITGYLSFDDTKGLFVSEVFAKDIICNRLHDTIVIAWMPLPEPYKAESEE